MTDADSEQLPKLLEEWRRLPGETEWLEFKGNNAKPDDIGRYASALSNSAALLGRANAYVIWGVADETHEIIGTRFRARAARKGNEELENWLLRLLDPSPHLQFRELDIAGKHVCVLRVPRAWDRPVRFKGEAYLRVGSYTKKLKDYPRKERELWGVFETVPFEQQVAAERLSETDVVELLDYPSYFRLLGMPLPADRAGILARLSEDAMIVARDDGRWNVLNLGAVLFASDLSRFRHLARKAVRVIEYDGDGRIRTKREHQGRLGYAAGFEGLIGFLKGILPENEVVGEALRKSVPMYPELAIRELVANVIIHQDFTIRGTGPMVEVFDGRLEITNPGKPLVDTRRFLDAPPRSRNEALASFLRRANICEERGSGVDKIVFETEFCQLPAPLFEVAGGHTRAVLFAHRPFRDMDKSDRVRACYLHACLQHVRHKRMSNKTLRNRFGVDERNRAQVTRVINDTREAGLIRPHDPKSTSRKHASYVPYWA